MANVRLKREICQLDYIGLYDCSLISCFKKFLYVSLCFEESRNRNRWENESSPFALRWEEKWIKKGSIVNER